MIASLEAATPWDLEFTPSSAGSPSTIVALSPVEDSLETVLKLGQSFPDSNADAALKTYASYVHIHVPTINSTMLAQRLSRSTCTRNKC